MHMFAWIASCGRVVIFQGEKNRRGEDLLPGNNHGNDFCLAMIKVHVSLRHLTVGEASHDRLGVRVFQMRDLLRGVARGGEGVRPEPVHPRPRNLRSGSEEGSH